MCDAGGRVVEALNMTTDTYEVVFNGTLPSGTVLKDLPGLREIDMRLHTLKGELPSEEVWMVDGAGVHMCHPHTRALS